MAEAPLWTGKKRWLFGLPWTTTRYTLTDNCLYIRSGIFNVKEEEIRLFRVQDITLHQNFRERILRLGTIHLCTKDKSAPEIDIRRIKNPKMVRTLLSDRVEAERKTNLEGYEDLFGAGARRHDHAAEE